VNSFTYWNKVLFWCWCRHWKNFRTMHTFSTWHISRNPIPKLTAFRPGQSLCRTDEITDQNVVPLKSSYNICTDREMHIKIIDDFLFPQKLRLNHAMWPMNKFFMIRDHKQNEPRQIDTPCTKRGTHIIVPMLI